VVVYYMLLLIIAKKKKLDESKRVCIVLPDGVRNYMTKFLSKDWMIENKFLSSDEYLNQNHPLYGVSWKSLGLAKIPSYSVDKLTVGEALELFEKGAKVIPLTEEGKVKGVVWPHKLL